jgi:hypothetical protein
MKKILFIGLLLILGFGLFSCDAIIETTEESQTDENGENGGTGEIDENETCSVNITFSFSGSDLGSEGADFTITFVDYTVTVSNSTCSNFSDNSDSGYFDAVSRSGDILSLTDDDYRIYWEIPLSENTIQNTTITKDNDSCGNEFSTFSGTLNYSADTITINYVATYTNIDNCEVFNK